MRQYVVVAALAVAALAARLVFLGSPVMADEAGLLMVAAQWEDGESLYGGYWVDRPPGLIALVASADALGGGAALRVLGAVAAGAAVVAAAWLGARAAPGRRWAMVFCATIVAAPISHPLLDVDEINAEILALPVLLAGLVAVVAATESGSTTWWAVAAGVAGTTAVLIKQNLVEVWLAVAVAAVVLGSNGRYRQSLRIAGGFLVGAVLAAAPVLTLASSRGTTVPGLWDALVMFRLQASEVILDQASQGTAERARGLALAFVATGMPVALLLLTRLRRRAVDHSERPPRPGTDSALVWMCVIVLSWEIFAVILGGSYWLHYLLLPVPGLALLAAVSMRRDEPRREPSAGRRTFLLGVSLPMVVSTLIGLAVVLSNPVQRPSEDQAVIDYLDAHRDRGTTAVVAFGNPALLRAAEMTSPYEHLWSLPVRVRDPALRQLISVLRSPDRPHWVVLLGRSLETWGIDAVHADRVLKRHYRPVFETEEHTIYLARSGREVLTAFQVTGNDPPRSRP